MFQISIKAKFVLIFAVFNLIWRAINFFEKNIVSVRHLFWVSYCEVIFAVHIGL